jgi:hypothetical protein
MATHNKMLNIKNPYKNNNKNKTPADTSKTQVIPDTPQFETPNHHPANVAPQLQARENEIQPFSFNTQTATLLMKQKENTFTSFNKPEKIYISPYLDNSLRPSNTSLAIPHNLEPLRSLIMSQHEAFSQNILDLGDINLMLTSSIDKKLDSYHQLKFNNKIPRSLRI